MRVLLSACRADSSRFDLERNRALLSPERESRLACCPPEERQRSVAAHWLLERQLRELGFSLPQPISLRYGENGKPALADFPGLHFNLSHSGRWAVCALCRVPVGVDIQEEKRVSERLERRFSASEQALLRSCPEEARNRARVALWSLKEAYCKCTGAGLLTPLDEATFTLSPVTIDCPGFTAALPDFPDTAYCLALCAETEGPLETRLTLRTAPQADGMRPQTII